MTDFLSSLKIAATGLHAQNARMRVIAEILVFAVSVGLFSSVVLFLCHLVRGFAGVDDAQHLVGEKLAEIRRLPRLP